MIDPVVAARVNAAMSMIRLAVEKTGAGSVSSPERRQRHRDGTPRGPEGRSADEPSALLATVAAVAGMLLIELERELVPQQNGHPAAIDGHRLEAWLDSKAAELDPGSLR